MVSVVLTDNGDLISTALRLHLRRVHPLVADVTYGRGLFWRRHNGVRLIGSDIRALHGIVVQADFRAMPYRDNCFDAVVLDPPYLHDPGAHHSTDARYGAATMGAATHDDTGIGSRVLGSGQPALSDSQMPRQRPYDQPVVQLGGNWLHAAKLLINLANLPAICSPL
jgi:hypothetical protein